MDGASNDKEIIDFLETKVQFFCKLQLITYFPRFINRTDQPITCFNHFKTLGGEASSINFGNVWGFYLKRKPFIKCVKNYKNPTIPYYFPFLYRFFYYYFFAPFSSCPFKRRETKKVSGKNPKYFNFLYALFSSITQMKKNPSKPNPKTKQLPFF